MVDKKGGIYLSLLLLMLIGLFSSLAAAASPQPDILLVRDAHTSYIGADNPNEVYGDYYENALKYNGLEYDVCTVPEGDDNGPAYDDQGGCDESVSGMNDYDMVVWFTGDDYGGTSSKTLTERDRGEISSYLDSGGRMFLTGQHIGFDIGATEFYENYINAEFIKVDSLDDYSLLPFSDKDPISSSTLIDIDGGAGNQDSPSIIRPIWGADKSFIYTTQKLCKKWGEDEWDYKDDCRGHSWYEEEDNPAGSIRTDTGGPSGYKVAYASFGFEGIYGSDKRERVMDRVFNYLTAPEVENERLFRETSQVEGDNWMESNLTCDPRDEKCHRGLPKVNATCKDPQLFSDVKSAEYFIDSRGEGNGTSLEADDGTFGNESKEEINGSVDVSNLTNTDKGDFTEHTLRIHCQGGDDYWGKFAEKEFILDRFPPTFLEMDILSHTSTVTPNITGIRFTDDPDDVYTHYMRFSCDDSNWTDWTEYSQSYSGFNITDGSYGCPTGDGSKTVYMQIRDEAGNWEDSIQDSVVLDRKAPSVEPGSPSGPVSGTVEVNATINDPTSTVENASFILSNSSWRSESYYLSENQGVWNTSLDSSEVQDGAYTLEFRANDPAGNVNSTMTLSVEIDNSPPEIDIRSPSSDTYSGSIDLESVIDEPHLDTVWFDIRNSSDLSQVLKEGDCSTSPCQSTWDSNDLSGNGSFLFNVSANDTLSQSTYNVNVTFEVDNRVPSVKTNFPDEDFITGDFDLNLVTSSPGANAVNISNAYYNRSNSTFSKVNETVDSPGSIGEPNYTFSETIELSSWCGGRCSDGNYSLFFWSNNTESRQSEISTWFYIDTTPPEASDYQLNLSEDPEFGDRRLFVGRKVSFQVNVSESVKKVDRVNATLEEPGGTVMNRTLEPGNSDYKSDSWSFTYTPSGTGVYSITDLYANDTLGNMLHNGSVGIDFRAVNISSSLDLDGSPSVDAGTETYINTTYDFNKSVQDPSLELYIPPNRPGDTGNEPYYRNVSSYTCSFRDSCTVEEVEVSGETSYLEISGSGTNSNISISGLTEPESPEKDSAHNWTFSFDGFSTRNLTEIEAPLLDISSITCEGSSTCEVNQSEEFDVSFDVDNVQDATHAGKAFNVTARVNTSWNSRENVTDLGDLASNSANSTPQFGFNITEVGNYTFDFKAWDSTLEYNTTDQVTVEVQDTEPPEILEREWPGDNIFNRNRTVNYRVRASDNVEVSQVTATVKRNGYEENVSLVLENRYDEYDRWEMVYENDTAGVYNITDLYFKDTAGNLRYVSTPSTSFEIEELDLTVDRERDPVEVVEGQTLYANVSGNASGVSRVNATVYKPRGAEEEFDLGFEETSSEVREYSQSYTNVSRSGNYTANISVELDSGANLSKTLNFTSPYGNASIEGEDLEIVRDRIRKITWFIFPEEGDLIDVNATLSSGNESLLNVTNSESFKKEIGNITWEEYRDPGYSVSWEINASNSTGETNLNLDLTSSEAILEKTGKIVKVNVLENDTERPDIISVNQSYDEVNLDQENTISVNATDDETSVDTVTVEMAYPGGAEVNHSASLEASGIHTLEFSDTNETGTFDYTVYVSDSASNTRVSSTGGFNVTDEYEALTITSNPYNKGDNITFEVNVTDARGEPVEEFNLTMNLSKDGNIEEIVDGEITDAGSYQVKSSDPPESSDTTEKTIDYTVKSLVEKSGNKGSEEKKVKVSEELVTTTESHSSGDYYASGDSIPVEVEVEDMHGKTVSGAAVTAECSDCDKTFERIEWNESREAYYDSGAFTAPEVDEFSIWVYSVDFWKNKGYDASLLTTTEPQDTTTDTSDGDTGGGGGGGGGVAPSLDISRRSPDLNLPADTSDVNLSVETDMEASCQYSLEGVEGKSSFSTTGGTVHSETVEVEPGRSYSYEVLCQTPDDLSSDTTVAFSVTSEEIESYQFEVPEEPLEADLGGKTSGQINLFNNGTERLNVELSAQSDCCDTWFEDLRGERLEELSILPEAGKAVQVRISVPMNVPVGKKTVLIRSKAEDRVRERTVTVNVVEGEMVERFDDLVNRSSDLQEKISLYRRTGVDTSDLEEEYNQLQKTLVEARKAKGSDDRSSFQDALESSEELAESIDRGLQVLSLRQYILANWWRWAIAGGGVYLMFFLLTMVVLPYYRLRTKLLNVEEDLESSVEARKKAEKQYFKREIDRGTFMQIMTERQDEILEMRGQKQELEEELDNLLQNNITLENFLKAPLKAFREVSGWWKETWKRYFSSEEEG
ncbi:MAG: Ig-like domain-containing protein [Candidatus Nanohaloarchaeota archaeon QJJ-7]|nr:Ig-like domain-containing protein [Candidatus Nanohaloarchaeota archaeon QJJ-7]